MILCVKGSSGQGVFPVFGTEIVLVMLGKFRAAGYVLASETAETIFVGSDVQYISCHLVGTVRPRSDAVVELEVKAPRDVLLLLGDDIPEQVKQHLRLLVRSWQKRTA